MRLHLGEVADVADVVARAVLVRVVVNHILAGYLLGQVEGLEDRAAVTAPAAQVVHLGHAWLLDEALDETGHVERMDVVAYLLALVAEDRVLLIRQVALDEVAQEAVQLDARVVRASEAAAAQAGRLHVEVPAVLLHHDVGRDLRRAEE